PGKSSVKLGSAIRRLRIAAGRWRSALVALDGALVANRRLVGILSGGTPSTALVEQVPALVERHLELREPLAVAIARLAATLALEQLVLLAGEVVDPSDDVRVVRHLSMSPTTKKIEPRIAIRSGTSVPGRTAGMTLTFEKLAVRIFMRYGCFFPFPTT